MATYGVSAAVKGTAVFIFSFSALLSVAQKSGSADWEIGATAGIGWYNGDLNADRFFDKRYFGKAYTLHVRKNLNQRFSLKAQYSRATVSAADELSNNPAQLQRNLSFSSQVNEGWVGIEFNYHPFDALLPKKRITSYTFIGLGAFTFNPTTDLEGNVYELRPLATEGKNYKPVALCMPFGVGLKWAITDRLLLGVEWGLRRTSTDYLDDVSGTYPLAGELSGLAANLSDRSTAQNGPDGTNWGTQRGNSKSEDWYNIVSAGLALRIGPKKGSCKNIGVQL